MIYISLQEVIEYHSEIISRYGGVHGIRDIGLLASALEMPKAVVFDEELHPSVFDKAAAYLYHLINNYPFIDGNKRIAATMAITFLRINEKKLKLTDKLSKIFEDLVVEAAAGKIAKKELSAFFKKHCMKKKKLQTKSMSS